MLCSKVSPFDLITVRFDQIQNGFEFFLPQLICIFIVLFQVPIILVYPAVITFTV
jgi:hypothetical protein